MHLNSKMVRSKRYQLIVCDVSDVFSMNTPVSRGLFLDAKSV